MGTHGEGGIVLSVSKDGQVTSHIKGPPSHEIKCMGEFECDFFDHSKEFGSMCALVGKDIFKLRDEKGECPDARWFTVGDYTCRGLRIGLSKRR